MNQYFSRTLQLYSLSLFAIALFNFNLTLFCLALFVGWILQGISLETLIHRKYAHNQYDYKNKFFELLSYLILLSTSLGRPYEWAYGHRVHHRYTDDKEDPQSPHSIGLLRTFFSIFPSGVKGWDGIDKDLRSQKNLLIFNKYYYHLYIVYNLFWLLIDPLYLVYFVGIPSFMAWLTLGIINTTAHLEKHNPKDISFPLYFWGGNYHGTHHLYPKQTNLGSCDLSYYVIKLIGNEHTKQ